MRVDLGTPRSLRTAFLFPLQSAQARREVLIGALWLLVPVIGWLINMGHRIMMVHRMQHGQSAWPAFGDSRELLRHGWVTFLGMVAYTSPGLLLLGVAAHLEWLWLAGVGLGLVVLAIIAIPGYMTHYCVDLDRREIFDPRRALGRVLEGGRAYWHAWSIALLAMALSFAGLLGFGVGFLATSVWFWQVAGFSFARVFNHQVR